MTDAISRSAVLDHMCSGCSLKSRGDGPTCGSPCSDYKYFSNLPAIDAVPKKPKRTVHFVPCVCGYTKHSEWRDTKKGVWFYDCLKCGITSEKYAAKTKTDAKIGWNRMIEEMNGAQEDGANDV